MSKFRGKSASMKFGGKMSSKRGFTSYISSDSESDSDNDVNDKLAYVPRNYPTTIKNVKKRPRLSGYQKLKKEKESMTKLLDSQSDDIATLKRAFEAQQKEIIELKTTLSSIKGSIHGRMEDSIKIDKILSVVTSIKHV